jgi:transcription antitermination factor NusG
MSARHEQSVDWRLVADAVEARINGQSWPEAAAGRDEAAAPEPQTAAAWYALKVPGGKELAAEEILLRRGHVAFTPLVIRTRRPNGYSKRKERVEVPMLPGYTFAGFSGPPDWLELFQLSLVRGVVGIAGVPMQIPHDDLRPLFECHGRPAIVAKTRARLKPGDRARFHVGSFSGLFMTVERVANGRAAGMLNALGGVVPVEAPLELLEIGCLE